VRRLADAVVVFVTTGGILAFAGELTITGEIVEALEITGEGGAFITSDAMCNATSNTNIYNCNM
jgi:hypothetical protein